MNCKGCKHWKGGRGDAFCLSSCPEYRADIPLSHHGVSEVGFDELAGTQWEPRTEDAQTEPLPEPPPVHGPNGAFLSAEAAEMLRAFLRKMATLSHREFAVLVRRMEAATSINGHPTYAEIGAELKCTKQTVKYLMGNVAAKVPEMLAFFPAMRQTLRPEQERMRSGQKRRRPKRKDNGAKRQKGPVQMLLFDIGDTQ